MGVAERADQCPLHPVGGAQAEFARRFVEHVDRAGFGARKLHRLRHDGVQHHFEIERGIDGLRGFAERAQFLDRAGQLVGARPQLAEQPRVLDGDHGLCGEAFHESNLFIR